MQDNKIARIAVSGVSYWFDKPYSYAVPASFASSVIPGVRVAVPFGGSRPREGIVLAVGIGDISGLKSILEILDDDPILTQEQIKLALWMRERFFCTVSDAVRAILPSGLWYKISSVYVLNEAYTPEKAYAAAGKSKAEKLVLDTVLGHGNQASLSDIEAVFAEKNPAPALASLVKKGVLLTQSQSIRNTVDRTVRKVSLAVSKDEAKTAIDSMRRAVRQSAVLRVLCEFDKLSLADVCYFTGSNRDSIHRLEQKGLVTISDETYFRRPAYERGIDSALPQLNDEQQAVFDGLLSLMNSGKAQAALLLGVTGSGKTTVYIHLIAQALSRGKSAILLVPEIALTPQMLKSFSSHFGDDIAVLHSSLSVGERYDEWKRIRSGSAKLVIGTRSAVFAPVQNLGCIIIDEEQEDTYKSENAARYHARDVAKYICAQNNALLLLGSATPNISSMYGAQLGKYSLFRLPNRFNKMQLPTVSIIDMKQELHNGNGGVISSYLRNEIQTNLDRGEQSILFLNRRGANKLVSCTQCGYTYSCPNCTRALTYHSVGNRLMCHCCGHVQVPDAVCPDCGGQLSYTGAGTQKIVEELNTLFPDVNVLRMDTDSVGASGNHGTLLEKFRSQDYPIMVGTQMVTKGLNFENVTLVGVLSADQSLYSGSYLSAERTFSLITQVIGRSGRYEKPGRAVIQTFTPENQVIKLAAMQDYESFYQAELAMRQLSDSPPFREIFVLTVCGEDESLVLRCCADLKSFLSQETGQMQNTKILGPASLPIARLNRTWRYRVTVSTNQPAEMRRILSALLVAVNNEKNYRGLSVWADYDPLD